jgi:hypothetical protein
LGTHVPAFAEGGLILGSDTEPGAPPRPAVCAAAVADCLGELAGYGCRVALLLDGGRILVSILVLPPENQNSHQYP